MNTLRFRGIATLLASATVALSTGSSSGAPPLKPSASLADPGRGIAGTEDAAAIGINPANLAFLPTAELRGLWMGADSNATVPTRGFSLGVGVPFWMLASGLRLDGIDPSQADSRYGIRWALAVRAGDNAALGTTFGWGTSKTPYYDDWFSATTGLTVRPAAFLSMSVVARDWNEPVSRSGSVSQRSWDVGLALRPWHGSRVFELGAEAQVHERKTTPQGDNAEVVPRGIVGLDVPYLGRLRGEVTVLDPDADARFMAMAGLDVHLGTTELGVGGVFGDAAGETGMYAGMAVRGFREPGLRLPTKVARIAISSTPGVRRHTRLLRRLWAIAEDPEMEGVILQLRAEPASSMAHAEELGDAIRLLKQRGKKVLCHLEDAKGKALFVCSQADRIALNPAGGLRFAGLSSSYFYFGDLLKKLGVRADFVRIGEHKLAAEQFTRAGGSPVAHVEHQELITETERVFLHDVGGGRRISATDLKARIARGPFVADEARAANLVDVLAYQDEIGRVAEEMFGRPVRIMDEPPPERAPDQWGNRDKVAVIYLSGDMVDGESQFIPVLDIRLAGSVTISKALKRAREDATVKAVVFRIETGGGSSLAADVILREAILTARAKPFVVSMGSHAASGGYYASMPDKTVGGARPTIFASRTTITGSIGIFYGKVDVSGLLDKLGVHLDQYRSAPRADAESFFRPFTDDERSELGAKVKQFYDVFVGRVAEGRGMKPEEVDAVARGRVWTGEQALQRKLVDRLGGLREALAEARKLGGLPADSAMAEYPDEDDSLLGFLLNMVGLSSMSVQDKLAVQLIPPALMDFARALSPFLIFDSQKPLARMELLGDVGLGPRDIADTPTDRDE